MSPKEIAASKHPHGSCSLYLNSLNFNFSRLMDPCRPDEGVRRNDIERR